MARPTPLAAAAMIFAALAAHVAFARPLFSVGVVDASDGTIPGGRPGTGIDIIGGTIFQVVDSGPPWVPPPIPSEPSVYDSYLAVDYAPVSDDWVASPVEEVEGSLGFGPSDYRGAWHAPGSFAHSWFALENGQLISQLFLGRITHTGAFEGRLALDLHEDLSPGYTTIIGNIVTPAELNSGLGWITHDINGTALTAWSLDGDIYAFVRKEFEVDIEGVTYTVSDLYIQSLTPVPTPGALTVLASAGLVAIRRLRAAGGAS